MAYTICNLDKMSGTEDSSLLVSVRYYDSDGNEAELENGSIVEVGDFLDGEREVRKATAPTASSKIKNLALVASPEIIYDETRHHGLEEYINAAGKDIRAYRFHNGDGFSITAEGFSDTPAKGSYVTFGDTTKFGISSTETDASIGKIDEIWTLGNDTYYYVQVSI